MKRCSAKVGYGTYRLVAGSSTHKEALTTALEKGLVSFIDTSPNYGDGESETLVGDVLSSFNPSVTKNVTVCTKFGFIEGANVSTHKENPFPDASEFTDSCFHSIHPDFMRHQLKGSLERLKKVDLLLLHNPEHYLMAEIHPETDPLSSDASSQLIHLARSTLLQRIRDSFVALEEEVKAGRIGAYGISSNSFGFPASHPHFVPFDTMISLAQAASKEVNGAISNDLGQQHHSFQAIQMPGNLLEREGLTPIYAGGNGCAEWACKNGLQVIINRPLSAFTEEGTWRFAEVEFPSGYSNAREALIQRLTPELPTEAERSALSEAERQEISDVEEACSWLKQLINDLDGQITSFSSILHYSHDFNNKIFPMIMEKVEGMDEETMSMLHAFFVEYEKAVRSVTGQLARQNALETIERKTKNTNPLVSDDDFQKFLPTLTSRNEPLQDIALKWLLRHEYVSTILVGMGSKEQVGHVQKVLESA